MGRRISDPMSTSLTPKQVSRVLLDAMKKGYVTMIIDADGEPRYRITELGIKHLERVIDGEEEK
jgi:DNA-binding PadR family transcriptional regulator